MKNYNEIADSVLSRRDEYEKEQSAKRKKMIRISSFASCFVIVAVLGVGIWQGGWLDFSSLPTADSPAQEGYDIEITTKTNTTQEYVQNQTTAPTEAPTTELSTTGQYTDGGNVGGWFIPALPDNKEISITGEAITDEEAMEYFRNNKNGIIGSLSSSGVASDSVRISETGYCHINYNGEEDKSFEIRQNYRDYLVYNGENLVAIITLYKENGVIFNTPSFGARWFDNYNAYLQEHKGDKLIFIYAGWLEIIIAPDNTYFNPMEHDVSQYLEGIEKPYELFYHEKAIYVP